MRILGIDFGEARTGLAISDENEMLSTVVGTIHERDLNRLAEKIAAVCQERGVQKIVLGLPKNMDGTEGFRAEHTRKFQHILEEVLPDMAFDFFDERLTTISAARIMNEAGSNGKKKKQAIDALSAQIILEDYLRCR